MERITVLYLGYIVRIMFGFLRLEWISEDFTMKRSNMEPGANNSTKRPSAPQTDRSVFSQFNDSFISSPRAHRLRHSLTDKQNCWPVAPFNEAMVAGASAIPFYRPGADMVPRK